MDVVEDFRVERLNPRPEGPTVWAVQVDWDYEGRSLEAVAVSLSSAREYADRNLDGHQLKRVYYTEFELTLDKN